jgi:aminoglycoside 3-N-acetyltransferase
MRPRVSARPHPRHRGARHPGADRTRARSRRSCAWGPARAAAATDEEDSAELGAAFDATGATRIGPVGEGEARLMRRRELVEFAARWMAANRGR